MAVVAGVVTAEALKYWPQFFGGLLGITSGVTTPGSWNPIIRSFKIGRGGWAAGPVPRTPDNTLTDLDVILDYGRAGPSKRYTSLAGNIMFVEKALLISNFTWINPHSLKVSCTLALGEFNDIQGVPSTPPGGSTLSPAGVAPVLYELGLFSDHPSGTGKLMVAYGTFSGETKTGAAQLLNEMLITFG